MCVLIVAWHQRQDAPLVLAANRDEDYTRAFRGPEWVRTEAGWALAPRDLQAGGTWIGSASSGLAVAITNRRDGDSNPRRPSRGHLCRLALGRPDAADLRRWLAEETTIRRYNAFNLFFADRDQACVASWNGTLSIAELAPGVHVLTNDHALGELRLPPLVAFDWDAGDLEALPARLAALLADHAPHDAAGTRICKHGERGGTVCSTLLLRPRATPGWLDWAPGSPCRTPFSRIPLDDVPRD